MHAILGRTALGRAGSVLTNETAKNPTKIVSSSKSPLLATPTFQHTLNRTGDFNDGISRRLFATSSKSTIKEVAKVTAKKAKATVASEAKPKRTSSAKKLEEDDEDKIPEHSLEKPAKKTRSTKKSSATVKATSTASSSSKLTSTAGKVKKTSSSAASHESPPLTPSSKGVKAASKRSSSPTPSPTKSSLKRSASLPELVSPKSSSIKEPSSKRTKKSAAVEPVEPVKPRGRSKKSDSVEVLSSENEVVAKKTASSASAELKAPSKTETSKKVATKASSSSLPKRSAKSAAVADLMKDVLPKKSTRRSTKQQEEVQEDTKVASRSRSRSTPAPVTTTESSATTTKREAKVSAVQPEVAPIVELAIQKPENSALQLSRESQDMIASLPSHEDEFIINDRLVNEICVATRHDRRFVGNALHLLQEGNTVPFITRYRKEMIGEMNETQLRNIHKAALQFTALQRRKHTVLETILSRGFLTAELEREILDTTTLRHLEDLYSPYRPKKNSLASVAISKGLLPLAETLLTRPHTDAELEALIQKEMDPKKGLKTREDILIGVQHIWAEKASDSARLRESVRPIYTEFGTISVSESNSAASTMHGKSEDEQLPSRKRADTFAFYFSFSKPLTMLRSHNVMAINRGEREKFLKVKFTVPEPEVLIAMASSLKMEHSGIREILGAIQSDFAAPSSSQGPPPMQSIFDPEYLDQTLSSWAGKKPRTTDLDSEDGDLDSVPSVHEDIPSSSGIPDIPSSYGIPEALKNYSTHYRLAKDSIIDSFKRLLHPSLVNEARQALTESAENESIATFSKNLKSRLLQPPVNGHIILAIDPGFTHGCKTCVIDSSGKVLDTRIIFPFVGASAINQKLKDFDFLVRKFNVTLIAIGNGTAHRETIDFVKRYRREANEDINWCLVDESGASVYSVSAEAQAEFPNLDPAGRGAASIARRTLDPLAEIVKIPTQSIGVGSYQHDVNQKELERSLSSVVEDCVNYVGANLNTASQALLRRISGLTSAQAQNIVKFRDDNGSFNSRSQLKDIKGIGPKTFTQCAGFLRIPGSSEPLDNTNIHPEAYPQVTKLLKSLKHSTKDILDQSIKQKLAKALDGLDIEQTAATLGLGVPTLCDIISDLKKPGRDPRAEGNITQIENPISTFEELKMGMTLVGRVQNVTGFGVFVDVGIKQNGLALPKDIIDPVTNLPVAQFQVAVSTGYVGQFEVLKIDTVRQRFNLRLCLTDQSKLM